MLDVLLVINTGSSSIKFSIVESQPELKQLYHGEIESLTARPCLRIVDADHQEILKQVMSKPGLEAGLKAFFNWFLHQPMPMRLKAVGHRVVHGGAFFSRAVRVTDEVMNKLATLIPFVPFHQPASLDAIKMIQTLHPEVAQVACFDTVFHHTQEKLATLFAIPHALTAAGMVRYGFHGLSYEYIASVITQYMGEIGNQRIIVAHLGNGASLCAMYQRKSVATSMGLTALDGLMMGTRCGAIDPGLILYLLKVKKGSVDSLTTLLYQESGLLGVSGISHDMRVLQSSQDKRAIEAVDLFCYRAAREIGALFTVLEGCDAIVFTGGIGENSSVVRKKICARLACFNVLLDETANTSHAPIISREVSQILVSIIPADEARMIAEHTFAAVQGSL